MTSSRGKDPAAEWPPSNPQMSPQPIRALPGVDKRVVQIKLIKWLLFEVLFSLMALAFNWGHTALNLNNNGSSLATVAGRGELLLISAAIVAAGVGDLIKEGLNTKLQGTKMLLTGLGMEMVATSAWLYSEVASSEPNGINPSTTVGLSAVVTLSSLTIAIACMIVAEVK